MCVCVVGVYEGLVCVGGRFVCACVCVRACACMRVCVCICSWIYTKVVFLLTNLHCEFNMSQCFHHMVASDLTTCTDIVQLFTVNFEHWKLFFN